jgi:hypothetical protein
MGWREGHETHLHPKLIVTNFSFCTTHPCLAIPHLASLFSAVVRVGGGIYRNCVRYKRDVEDKSQSFKLSSTRKSHYCLSLSLSLSLQTIMSTRSSFPTAVEYVRELPAVRSEGQCSDFALHISTSRHVISLKWRDSEVASSARLIIANGQKKKKLETNFDVLIVFTSPCSSTTIWGNTAT